MDNETMNYLIDALCLFDGLLIGSFLTALYLRKLEAENE